MARPFRSMTVARAGGFTVLEVLIAFAILAIGFSAIFALLAQGHAAHRSSMNVSAATLLAETIFDDIALRYGRLYYDRNRNGTPDLFEDLNRNGIPDRREAGDGRPPMDNEFPRLDGYEYDIEFSHDSGENRFLHEVDGVERRLFKRQVFARVRVYWHERSVAYARTFQRVVFLKEDP